MSYPVRDHEIYNNYSIIADRLHRLIELGLQGTAHALDYIDDKSKNCISSLRVVPIPITHYPVYRISYTYIYIPIPIFKYRYI